MQRVDSYGDWFDCLGMRQVGACACSNALHHPLAADHSHAMPNEQTVQRRDKLGNLIAVFDAFHEALMGLDEPLAQRLTANWARARRLYVYPPEGVTRSTLATGMEQGLRETPKLIQSMSPEARRHAAQALASATQAHYPDFLAKTAERIAKVKARGSICGESEFNLIRHQVDELEGIPGDNAELQQLYELPGGV